jgi:serine phosphatase RsbU (regulator of sigma subunit)
LFTDGAVEIANAQDEELGEAGLRALLEKTRFGAEVNSLEALERRLLAYSNSIRLPDDLTLLSIHRPAASSAGSPASRPVTSPSRPAPG